MYVNQAQLKCCRIRDDFDSTKPDFISYIHAAILPCSRLLSTSLQRSRSEHQRSVRSFVRSFRFRRKRSRSGSGKPPRDSPRTTESCYVERLRRPLETMSRSRVPSGGAEKVLGLQRLARRRLLRTQQRIVRLLRATSPSASGR